MRRIGVTVAITGSNTLFSNGVNQNALYLARVLKKCGYIVDLICGNQHTVDEIKDYEKDLNILQYEKSYNIRYNLIISVGLIVNKTMFKNWKLKNNDLKFVSYTCGNEYLINTERMLFDYKRENNTLKDRFDHDQIPHQVWSIPQMENTNYFFYKFLKGQEKVTVVPFIWDPFVIEHNFALRKESTYTPRPLERCGVMEPNMSVMKNSIFPTLILEKSQKKNPIKKIYLFGAELIKESKPYINFIQSTDVYKAGLLTVESRFQTGQVLTKHADFVLSWQWENNLNYLWFDVAWMGWPLVHNGSMCQDIGYYYEGFDGDGACQRIDEMINSHNDNYQQYLEKNRVAIKRFTGDNPKLVEQYKELVEDVLNNRFTRRQYDWVTNEVSNL
jgi:hypothetical protein